MELYTILCVIKVDQEFTEEKVEKKSRKILKEAKEAERLFYLNLGNTTTAYITSI